MSRGPLRVLHSLLCLVILYVQPLPYIDPCVEPSSPQKQTSLQAGGLGSTGWQRGKPRGLVGRKEVVRQDGFPIPPIGYFLSEKCVFIEMRGKCGSAGKWEEMRRSDLGDWWHTAASAVTQWGRSCAARRICQLAHVISVCAGYRISLLRVSYLSKIG